MDNKIPTSNNLLEVFNEVEKDFDQFVVDADIISNDIKSLEKFLSEKSVNFVFDFKCYEELIEEEIQEYFLSWRTHWRIKNGDFRLMYYSKNIRYKSPNDNIRPLIETSLKTRIKIHPYLPEFLKKFSEFVSSKNKE